MTTKSDNSKTERKALIITLIISLLGCGWLFYGNSSLRSENGLFSSRIDSLEIVKREITGQLSSANEKITNYSNEVKTKDSLISQYELAIKEKEKRINSLLAQNASLPRFKKEAKELKKINDDLLKRLKLLEMKNKELTNENDLLKKENDDLKRLLTDMEGKYGVMEKKVKIASILKIDNISITTEKKDKKGKYTKVRKAKKADRLVINFVIIENKVADQGPKELYIRIFDPANKLIQTSASGKFTNLDSNVETPYTKSEKISYANSKQKISVPVDLNDIEPTKGTYKIEVYEDGNYSGAGSIKLK